MAGADVSITVHFFRGTDRKNLKRFIVNPLSNNGSLNAHPRNGKAPFPHLHRSANSDKRLSFKKAPFHCNKIHYQNQKMEKARIVLFSNWCLPTNETKTLVIQSSCHTNQQEWPWDNRREPCPVRGIPYSRPCPPWCKWPCSPLWLLEQKPKWVLPYVHASLQCGRYSLILQIPVPVKHGLLDLESKKHSAM